MLGANALLVFTDEAIDKYVLNSYFFIAVEPPSFRGEALFYKLINRAEFASWPTKPNQLGALSHLNLRMLWAEP